MFDKKTKAPQEQVPLYRIVTITSSSEDQLNRNATDGYRFLEWFDDKWERNGYADIGGQRRAIYIKQ